MMEGVKRKVIQPDQRLIKTYLCKGCNRQVRQKELTIPIGPYKGDKTIANYGCICEDIKLAEKTKRARSRLKRNRLVNCFNYYSLINHSLKQATLENYNPTSEDLRMAKQKALGYIESFNGEQNLLFTGDFGTGKSHLSIYITKKLMEQDYNCLFLSLPKLLTKIKQTYNKSDITEDELLDVIQQVDLLVIDDIGSEQRTEWSVSKFFEILDNRAGKATIYTTNLNSAELKQRVNERNFSRIMENTEVIVMKGEDYRRRNF
ncbi:ATP-binding protein [Virgibacillus halodenitrificans]|uniref:ATP-binding protein n=1 Tax=Virgibacillus halodenitrificans TaxID=1482 RepID=UPI0024C071BA|nr:ATP-binding protein [Virgibacillus halodenitrificans]WHX25135.1 ATP-binding protein [Virgibacillus halodenitrificans]